MRPYSPGEPVPTSEPGEPTPTDATPTNDLPQRPEVSQTVSLAPERDQQQGTNAALWDGFAGSLVASLMAVAIALWVLRRQRVHDDRRANEALRQQQSATDKQLAASQLALERQIRASEELAERTAERELRIAREMASLQAAETLTQGLLQAAVEFDEAHHATAARDALRARAVRAASEVILRKTPTIMDAELRNRLQVFKETCDKWLIWQAERDIALAEAADNQGLSVSIADDFISEDTYRSMSMQLEHLTDCLEQHRLGNPLPKPPALVMFWTSPSAAVPGLEDIGLGDQFEEFDAVDDTDFFDALDEATNPGPPDHDTEDTPEPDSRARDAPGD